MPFTAPTSARNTCRKTEQPIIFTSNGIENSPAPGAPGDPLRVVGMAAFTGKVRRVPPAKGIFPADCPSKISP